MVPVLGDERKKVSSGAFALLTPASQKAPTCVEYGGMNSNANNE